MLRTVLTRLGHGVRVTPLRALPLSGGLRATRLQCMPTLTCTPRAWFGTVVDGEVVGGGALPSEASPGGETVQGPGECFSACLPLQS